MNLELFDLADRLFSVRVGTDTFFYEDPLNFLKANFSDLGRSLP